KKKKNKIKNKNDNKNKIIQKINYKIKQSIIYKKYTFYIKLINNKIISIKPERATTFSKTPSIKS
ncbi:hypothetical protein, partial [Salmonella enterica]|uniref:hypothetical protein n=1 Tax=Salmonella enterica TaxID=28901 RepID=UPI0020C34B30